ncbi:Ig-like domain-containing protein [Bradyrhizobium sp. ISRA435]|nr:Ig-like domain-containing protein [Bradyrhizobium sp. ISRA435]
MLIPTGDGAADLKFQVSGVTALNPSDFIAVDPPSAFTVHINPIESAQSNPWLINLADANAGVTVTGTAAHFTSSAQLIVTLNGHDYTATVATNGTWSVVIPTGDLAHASLSDGTYTLTAAVKVGSSIAASDSHSVSVDETPPSETISSTIGTDTGLTTTISSGGLTKDNTLALSGTVSDTNGVASVHIFDGSTDLGAASISGNTWTFTTSALSDGPHSFTAKAVDVAGNSTTTGPVTATVDTTTPAATVALTHDTAGAGTAGTTSDLLTSDASLTVSGQESGAATTYSVDGGGFSSSYDPTSLLDGSHTVVVRSTDQAGNTADKSITFTLDTTTPAATVALTHDTAGAGTAGTTSDLLTSDASLTVSGQESGAATTYSVDGGGFSSSYDPTSLLDGSHTVVVRSTDQAGNTADKSITFTLDTTTPAATVALTHDTAGAGTAGTTSDLLTSDASLTVSGQESGAATTYSVDGGGFSSSYDPTSLLDGSHTVVVRSTDQAGNTADKSITFTLDTTTPAATVALTHDTAGAGTAGTTSDLLTSDASLTVSGQESGAATTYSVDGGGFSSSYDPTSLLDGSHTVVVRSTDQAGNTADKSITFTLDTTTPAATVALTHDTAGAGTAGTTSDLLTSDASLTVSGQESGAATTYSVDGGGFSSSYDPTSLLDGSHTVVVRSTDQAGNTADKSITFTLDTTTPAATVALTHDTAGAGTAGTTSDLLTSDASLTVSGQESGAATTYSVDGGGFSSSYDPTSLLDGSHTVVVRSTDQAGNTADKSITFTLDTTTPAATVALTHDTAGAGTAGTTSDLLTSDASLTVSGQESGAATTYSVDGGGFSSSYDPTSLLDGSHTVVVRSTDQAGNTADKSITFTLDTTTPAATVALTHDTAGAGTAGTTSDLLTSDASLTVSGQESGAATTYSVDGGGFSSSYDPTSLLDGSHTVVVRSTDQAGNTADKSITFTLDTTTPAATVALTHDTAGAGTAGTTSDLLTSDASLTVSGQESGAATTYSVDGGGFSSSYDPTSLLDGSHTVVVRSTDQAGNFADKSITFTLDTTTPAATVALTHDTAGAGTAGTTSDLLTSDASLTVSGQESGAATTYSVDGGGFSSSYDPTSLLDGSHTVVVRSTDQAGNTADKSITFTLDTTTPAATVALTHDTAGAGTAGTTSDLLTSDASLTVSGQESGAATTYSVDGGGFSSSYDPTSLLDGSHTVVVRSTDQAGNTADKSITFTLDTTTPAATVALTHDTAGAGTAGTTSDLLTSDASLTVSGQESGAATTYSVDGGGFSSSYDPTSLLDGSHTVVVRSTDQAGNTADKSITFTLDTTTPAATVALTHDTAGAGTAGTTSDLLTSDASLTVSGQESGAATTYSVDGGGFSSSYDPTSLLDGSHTVVVRSTDQAGNTADKSITFTLDTTTPAATVALTHDTAGAGTAGTTSDLLTSDASLTVSGQESGAATTYSVDGGGFSSSYDPTSLLDGSHTVVVRSTDQAGNTADKSITFTLDTTTPAATVALTHDTAGAGTAGTTSDLLTSDASLTVSGQESGAATTYSVDGGGFSSSYDPTSLLDGSHTVVVRSTDQAGNFADKSITFTLDTTTPAATVALTHDTAGAGTAGTTSDLLTSDASLTVSGQESGAATTYSVDGGGFSSSYDPTSLLDGSHTVVVRSTDQAGNFADKSITFTLDTTTPAATVALTHDTAGAGTAGTTSDLLTSDASLTVSGQESGAATTYSVDGGGFSSSYDPTSLLDGSHTVVVRSTDQAGNTADKSITFTLDTTTPAGGTPDLTAASDPGASSIDNVTNVTAPSFTVALNLTVAVGDTVELLLGGSSFAHPVTHTITSTDVSAGSVTLTVASGDLGADGSKLISAKFTDPAGNTSTTSALAIAVDTAAAAPSAPDMTAATDSGSSSTDNITNNTTPVFTGSGAEVGATVTLYDTDGTTVLGTGVADGSGNWSITSSTLSSGSHTLTAKETDIAGNTSAASASLAVTIDTAAAAPSAPDMTAATDLGSSSTDNITNNTTPVFTGSGAEVGATVTLYDTDGTTVLGTGVADGSGNWSITSSTLSSGSHTLTAKETDIAGNTSAASASLAVTIDTTAPALTTVALHTPSTSSTNADSLVFRVTFSEAVTNVDTADFVVTGTTATATNVSLVSAGVYDVTVSGGDLASLNGTVSLALKSAGGGATINDLAGNALTNFATTGSSASYTEDNTADAAPTLSLSSVSSSTSSNDFTAITLTVAGFDTDIASATITLTDQHGDTATHTLTAGELSTAATTGSVAISSWSAGLTTLHKNDIISAAIQVNDTVGNTANHTGTFNKNGILTAPAGTAGEPINLALTDPPDHLGTIAVTVSGVPASWTLSEGTNNGDGTWTVQTHNIAALSITTPNDYAGALVLNVVETWTNADGSTGSATIVDNVEAYAKGSPIFAWSGDDNLSASSANDLLVFSQPIGHDVVYSFDAMHDTIDLIGYAGFTTLADIQAHTVNDAAGNAVITLGDGQSITLQGVDAASLSANDFVFDQTPVTDISVTMTIDDGSMLPLSGIIHNAGTIELQASGDDTLLQLIQTGITLNGGGQVVLSDDDHNIIAGTAPNVTLDNVDNVISGAGQLGEGQPDAEQRGHHRCHRYPCPGDRHRYQRDRERRHSRGHRQRRSSDRQRDREFGLVVGERRHGDGAG